MKRRQMFKLFAGLMGLSLSLPAFGHATMSLNVPDNNRIVLEKVLALLDEASSQKGQTILGEICQVTTGEWISITNHQGFGLSMDFADYGIKIRESENVLEGRAPTCDGMNEFKIERRADTRQLVVTIMNEFRGYEDSATCYLPIKAK